VKSGSRGTRADQDGRPGGLPYDEVRWILALFDCEIRSRAPAVSRMALTAGSLYRLQMGGLVSGSRCDLFGRIARGLGKFNRVIRVPRLPECGNFIESVGELCSLGRSGRGVRSAANCAQGRLHRLHPGLILGVVLGAGQTRKDKQGGEYEKCCTHE
jgi:hypothetical protein